MEQPVVELKNKSDKKKKTSCGHENYDLHDDGTELSREYLYSLYLDVMTSTTMESIDFVCQDGIVRTRVLTIYRTLEGPIKDAYQEAETESLETGVIYLEEYSKSTVRSLIMFVRHGKNHAWTMLKKCKEPGTHDVVPMMKLISHLKLDSLHMMAKEIFYDFFEGMFDERPNGITKHDLLTMSMSVVHEYLLHQKKEDGLYRYLVKKMGASKDIQALTIAPEIDDLFQKRGVYRQMITHNFIQ
jgi:hypothetical protein